MLISWHCCQRSALVSATCWRLCCAGGQSQTPKSTEDGRILSVKSTLESHMMPPTLSLRFKSSVYTSHRSPDGQESKRSGSESVSKGQKSKRFDQPEPEQPPWRELQGASWCTVLGWRGCSCHTTQNASTAAPDHPTPNKPTMCCFDLGDCLCGMCCAVCCLGGGSSNDRSHERRRDYRDQPQRVVYVQPVVVQQAPAGYYKQRPSQHKRR
jgi:hypothetical protein